MWRGFEESLKTASRFFSKAAAVTLSEVFAGLGDYRTQSGKMVIVPAGPGHKLHSLCRARVFQSDERLEAALMRPDKEIGPPSCTSGSRRPHERTGISVFYGAINPKVALAEVRPFVGSRVVTGRFEILRELRLLDLEAFRALSIEGSLFDPDFLRRLEKANFLSDLSHRIAVPVMPDDEAFVYLPTQAVADFLASEVDQQSTV